MKSAYERNAYLNKRAHWGGAGVRAGDPDYEPQDKQTALVDSLANIMHWAAANELQFADALERAKGHFTAELMERSVKGAQ